jgi:hypothetical protein
LQSANPRFADAVTRWESDTLVVETRNFEDDQNRAGDFLVSQTRATKGTTRSGTSSKAVACATGRCAN